MHIFLLPLLLLSFLHAPQAVHLLPSAARTATTADLRADWAIQEASNPAICPSSITHTTWARLSDFTIALPHNTIIEDDVRCDSNEDERSLRFYQGAEYDADFNPVTTSSPLPSDFISAIRASPVSRAAKAANDAFGEGYLIGYETLPRFCKGNAFFEELSTAFIMRPFQGPLKIANVSTTLVVNLKWLLMVHPAPSNEFCLYSSDVDGADDDTGTVFTPVGDGDNTEIPGANGTILTPTVPKPDVDGDVEDTPPSSDDASDTLGDAPASTTSSAGAPATLEEPVSADDIVPSVGPSEDAGEGAGGAQDVAPEDITASLEPILDEGGTEITSGPTTDATTDSTLGDDTTDFTTDSTTDPILEAGASFEPFPIPTSGDDDDESACFPADARVRLANGSEKRMDEVEIGDVVEVSEEKFSRIFSFTHRDAGARTSFVTIRTECGRILSASAGHLLYANDMLLAAEKISPTDRLRLANGESTRVSAIGYHVKRGLYNPQTEQGDIVVNGIMASTYTTAIRAEVAHAALTPVRAIYGMCGRNLLSAYF